jgi:ABC-type nickel/cobalt efflux system permease component RcnA
MDSLLILAVSAVSIALIHTLLGPDHYLPFVALARANGWSRPRTLAVTGLCGAGHVLSSILLGFIGIGAGLALANLEWIESVRGQVAAYLLIGFGLAYTAWGLRLARRNRPHTHRHVHNDGTVHEHTHSHTESHRHLHTSPSRMTWWLVILFGLGPCEPLIPLLMFPAAVHGTVGVLTIGALFGFTTILAMIGCVAVLLTGLSFVRPGNAMERYAHAIAGGTIAASGIAVQAFGL